TCSASPGRKHARHSTSDDRIIWQYFQQARLTFGNPNLCSTNAAAGTISTKKCKDGGQRRRKLIELMTAATFDPGRRRRKLGNRLPIIQRQIAGLHQQEKLLGPAWPWHIERQQLLHVLRG